MVEGQQSRRKCAYCRHFCDAVCTHTHTNAQIIICTNKLRDVRLPMQAMPHRWCALSTMEDSVTDKRWTHQHDRPATAAVLVLTGSVFCRVARDLHFFWSHPGSPAAPMDNRERRLDFNAHGCSRTFLVYGTQSKPRSPAFSHSCFWLKYFNLE